jgi:hypothetical protein
MPKPESIQPKHIQPISKPVEPVHRASKAIVPTRAFPMVKHLDLVGGKHNEGLYLPDPDDSDVHRLPAGALRMLKALASRHPLKLTRAQLGTLAGFTPSGGTFGNYYGLLKRARFIEELGQGTVEITESGLDAAGEIPEAPETTEEILAMWRRNLPAGAAKMLDVLVEIHPDGLTREELGERSGFTASGGTFGNYLGLLRRNELAEVQGTEVRASETLFLGGKE